MDQPQELPAPSSPAPPAPLSEDVGEREEAGKVPWRGRDLFFIFAAGMALSALFMIPIVILTGTSDSGALSFSTVGAMGIAIYLALCISGWYFALKRNGASLRDARLQPVSARTMLKMVPVTIGMMVLTGIVVSLSSLVFGDVPTAQDQVVGGANAISFNDFVWIFILGAIAAPIGEEFIFRGLLYPLLRNRLSVVGAVGISAIAFALVHFMPPLIPALLVMGAVLAIIVERFQSIYPAMLVHGLNNAAALIALYAAIGTG